MTRRAVTIHTPRQVTTHTEPHVVDVVPLEHLRHALHVPVTGHAGIGAHRLDVPHVGEMHVPGEGVDPSPFERRLGRVLPIAPELAELPDLRLVCRVGAGDERVAPHAGFHGRDAGFARRGHGVMAVLALDLVLAGVDVVTEEDRLAGGPWPRRNRARPAGAGAGKRGGRVWGGRSGGGARGAAPPSPGGRATPPNPTSLRMPPIRREW